MQKHQKIAYTGPKASPKSSISQSIIACATPVIRKKKCMKKKKSRMDKGLELHESRAGVTQLYSTLTVENMFVAGVGAIGYIIEKTTQQGAPWSFCDTTGYSFLSSWNERS